mmetsp:Transcript_2551/g.6893  ORF Transcript_2551/g.6893 Transcript_2551/m.6893 type:complete len:393 (+) Transcript_2551:1172-2350(+)
MVNIAVLRLVGTHGVHEIKDGARLAELPVGSGNFRWLRGAPCAQFAALRCLFNRLDDLGVRAACFLLHVPDESMAECRAENVRRRECHAESKLSKDDSKSQGQAGILHSHECQQVHSLIVGFLQEQLHVSAIGLHVTEGTEVADDGRHHSGNRCNRFQVDRTIQHIVDGDVVILPVGGSVEQDPHHAYRVVRHPVDDALRCNMGEFHIKFFRGVMAVRFAEADEFHSVATDAERMASALPKVLAVVTDIPRGHLDGGAACGDAVNGLDELVESYRSTGLAGIVQITELGNFFLGEGISSVLFQELLQFVAVDAAILVGIDLHQLRFDLADHGHVQCLQWTFHESTLHLDTVICCWRGACWVCWRREVAERDGGHHRHRHSRRLARRPLVIPV